MRAAFLGHWIGRFRGELALIGGLSLVSSAATLALPWLVAQLAARIVGEAGIDLQLTLVLLGLALAGLTGSTIMVTILSGQAPATSLPICARKPTRS